MSTAELATRSGISRPTLYRMLAGTSPRVDDLRDLAAAVGVDIDAALTTLSDPLAAVAARSILGDPFILEWTDDAEGWRERLRRYTSTEAGADAAVVDEAGRASAPHHRDGAVHLRGESWRVDRIVSAGRASGGDWALSGWAALDALGVDTTGPSIVWAPDARGFAQLLGDTFSIGRVDHFDLVVVPAHPSVFAGAVEIEDVRLVAPLQAHIDAVGLGGSVRDAALDHFRDAGRARGDA
ncbi:hypothetical protein ASF23_16045 [Curtobacterium sp. Leaf261]|nr:hypothetical protein ASF23_16045 [Curtobacterium sp. Leaf261]